MRTELFLQVWPTDAGCKGGLMVDLVEVQQLVHLRHIHAQGGQAFTGRGQVPDNA